MYVADCLWQNLEDLEWHQSLASIYCVLTTRILRETDSMSDVHMLLFEVYQFVWSELAWEFLCAKHEAKFGVLICCRGDASCYSSNFSRWILCLVCSSIKPPKLLYIQCCSDEVIYPLAKTSATIIHCSNWLNYGLHRKKIKKTHSTGAPPAESVVFFSHFAKYFSSWKSTNYLLIYATIC
jgi:hypothetical protein